MRQNALLGAMAVVDGDRDQNLQSGIGRNLLVFGFDGGEQALIGLGELGPELVAFTAASIETAALTGVVPGAVRGRSDKEPDARAEMWRGAPAWP